VDLHSRLASAPLPRITDLRAAIEMSAVTLNWPTVPGATSYRVYRASYYYDQPDDHTADKVSEAGDI
jgi:hypothetical protein